MRVRWNALDLDAELAAGADPGSSEELKLRAGQLAGRATREQWARSISEVLDLGERRSAIQLPTTRAPSSRKRISANRAALVELLRMLLDDGPRSPQGLARVNLLLHGRNSPLYSHQLSDDRLGPVLAETLTLIRPDGD